MGYYENPPIIPYSGDNSARYITEAGNAVAGMLYKIGERKRADEKEQKLTIQRLQERKNKLDLYYNDKYSDWKAKQTEVQGDADKQIQETIQSAITTAADNRLLLEQESDPKKRAEYLKSVSDADLLLNSSGIFAKKLTGQVASYRLKTPSNKIGEIGGSIVNGKNDEERLNNTAALEVLGGNPLFVKDSKIQVRKNDEGNGLLLTVSGHHKDTGEYFEVPIDSNVFNKSDEESDNGLLIPVESNDAFINDAKKTYFDEKGNNILPGFLSQTHETFDLDSKGTSGGNGRDIYQIKDGQRVQIDAIKAGIEQKAEISAKGLISTYANKPAKMRAFIGCTLKKGLEVYDKEFSQSDDATKLQLLKGWMTEDAMNTVTKNLEKTTTKEGIIYWNPSPNISIKQKPSDSDLTGNKTDKENYIPYQSKDYDRLITGSGLYGKPNFTKGQVDYRDRQSLTQIVNNLSGKSDKYITKEELFEMYKKQPYKSGKYDTGLTIQEAYNKGELKQNPSTLFKQSFGDSKVYMKEGEGAYKPVKGYDFNKAYDKVKFALDQTAGEGERKKLQFKLIEAKRYDWVKANPRKQGESLEAYKQRYERAN